MVGIHVVRMKRRDKCNKKRSPVIWITTRDCK